MKLRIKEKGIFGDKRTEIHVKIDDVLLKEDMLEPEKEKSFIFFKHGKHSGVLELNHAETEKLVNSLKAKSNLLKRVKTLRE